MKVQVILLAACIGGAACQDITDPTSLQIGSFDSPIRPLSLSTATDLVGHWTGDVDGADQVGANDGVLVNGLTGGNAGGKRNGALLFDGVDDGLDLGNIPELDFTQSSSFTLEAWISSFGPGAYPIQNVFALNYECSPTNQSVFLYDGQIYFVVRDENDTASVLTDPSILTTNALHHVVAVRDAGTSGAMLRLYVDGVLVNSGVDVTTGALSRLTNDLIGHNFPCATTNQFNGIIDEARIYLRALTDTEIQCSYRCDEELPEAINVAALPSRVAHGESIVLTATLDDQATGGSQITGAEYRIDSGSFVPMTAVDGSFDETIEDVIATVPASSLTGAHELCVRGTDLCEGKANSEACVMVVLDDEGPATTLLAASPNPLPSGLGFTLSAEVDDSSAGESIVTGGVYEIDGGIPIAMAAQDGAFDEVVEGVTASVPAFPGAGVHEVCVAGADEVGNQGMEECLLLAVFDPTAGFVTGAGLIDSPEGAYVPNPLAAGIARFAFVSRYKKGTSVPTGDTQFVFRSADLEFRSIYYDWLVIAGARAKFKGVGTINGSGDYGFMLTAIDGQTNGGGGIDGFRIKIWDRAADDSVVYDNQMGASDTGNDATALRGGQITIHP